MVSNETTGGGVAGLYEICAGVRRTVEPNENEQTASIWLKCLFATIAGLGVAACLGLAAAVVAYRESFVMKVSTWNFLVLIALGGAMAFGAIYAFLPTVTNTKCHLRQWVLPIAFDLIFLPLLLKTYRMVRVFNTSLKKVKITTRSLAAIVLLVLLFDILYTLFWHLSFPLSAKKTFSSINPFDYEYECYGEHSGIFQAVAIMIRAVPLLATFFFSYLAQSNIAHSRLKRSSIAAFDESSYISPILLNMFVVSLFVITLQYYISDNPNILLVYRCAGISWTSAFTVLVLILPKIIMRKQFENVLSKNGSGGGSRKNPVGGDDSKVTSHISVNIMVSVSTQTNSEVATGGTKGSGSGHHNLFSTLAA